MDAALAASRPVYVTHDLSVEEIEQLSPQLRLPARIAVAPPEPEWPAFRGAPGTWTPEEIAAIEAWEPPLRAAGVASELLVLPEALVLPCEPTDVHCRLESLRKATARVHADALLLLRLVTDTDDYLNPASVLYLSLVGLWLAPGSHSDALTIAEGVLLDHRNGFLYAFARGEGERRVVRPLAYVDSESVVQASRVAALRSLGEALVAEAGALRVR
jgi:hypothetical protein